MKTNKFWIFVFGGVVLVASVAAVLLWRTPATYARIYKDGELTETVNLAAGTEPFGLLVECGNYDTSGKNFNYLEVEHGRMRVSSADCPDGICIRQGWVSGGLLPIVCLPNRLVVTFDGGGSGLDVDAVAG
ncbi:MAG: NusG domain II-containing protein [Oscillospiraceae bacterium]|nr:NusG domain II-containing protein [Oscillospiraceae bacterium]